MAEVSSTHRRAAKVPIAVPIRRNLGHYPPAVSDLAQDLTDRALSALEDAGAAITVLPADELPPWQGPWPTEWAGLVLLGGGDIDPALYGESHRDESTWGIDGIVDRFELALTRAALAAAVPVFGICRGLQVMNVARGGTLVQSLPEDGPVAHRGVLPGPLMVPHPVRVDPDSHLARALGATAATVQSGHHQGLARLGQGLVAVAWAPDGLVEAVEDAESGSLGVQWHPEDARADPQQLHALATLFTARARSAPRRANGRQAGA